MFKFGEFTSQNVYLIQNYKPVGLMSDLLDVEKNPLGVKLACPYISQMHLCFNHISLLKR